ncbi:hypothetical protein BO70DRAFT_362261 [Aspergillus heteromorphus CBS 117.55]|uniref:MICOS complex subunit MIC12 n=1 Tax=Aspergillus heteromorphus CBS 117.55 TaxID=1448321 RepID=A0A317W800_9EURO|nr:uncharacterized protein BO70DRAFT_362261 [Aspergillus heteromorphus CBS 117.55]PWY81831.1 hypothetical protein BO70DRAFT_362261 [Aspergillus heteromorphus CBS 117.55]
MGFFTGFCSGFALTSSVLYLAVQAHRSNRLEQRQTIREQTRALNWVAESTGAYDRRLLPREDLLLMEQKATPPEPTLQDHLKHRWNQEVEGLARKAHESRWEDARHTAAKGWNSVVRFVKWE